MVSVVPDSPRDWISLVGELSLSATLNVVFVPVELVTVTLTPDFELPRLVAPPAIPEPSMVMTTSVPSKEASTSIPHVPDNFNHPELVPLNRVSPDVLEALEYEEKL